MSEREFYDPLDTPRHRFETDPGYRALVNMIEAMIHKAEFTPSELREAVIFAHIRYEQYRLRKIVIPVDQVEAIDGLKAIDNFINGSKNPA